LPPRTRERDVVGSRGLQSSSYRSIDIRRRLSPTSSTPRIRHDYKPPTASIKSRLAPRITPALTSRRTVHSVGSGRILRRNDLRTGIISKRISVPANRAKEYAKKIRQARLKLNEFGGGSSSSSKLKTGSETGKSPKGSDENNDEDFLAIANDVNFDDLENESTSGKVLRVKVKEEKKEAVSNNAGGDDVDDDLKKIEHDKSTASKESKEGRVSRLDHKRSTSRGRSFSTERTRKFDRIEYVCIHCDKHSTSAQVRIN
jgi:hypothetical protein